MIRIEAGYLLVAQRLQEAAAGLTSRDVCTRLRDTIQDNFRGSGTWAYYVDHIGDDQNGDVIYSVGDDMQQAPYEISGGGGSAAKCVIDFEQAFDVVPRTVYEPEADEADHYASMTESFKAGNIYTDLPLYERFISKAERDKADAGSFAGKGKSFPILSSGDVAAAARSLGRAGSDNFSVAKIKSNIIRIAKDKGWEKNLPKSWRSEQASESGSVPRGTGTLKLTESLTWPDSDVLTLLESANVSREIKVIAPGKGSSAYYPEEVLRRDGPGVFKKGTHIYVNHATAAEEAERPEGDWNKLVGALSSDAYWKEAGKHGAGLYAMAAFSEADAPKILAKAPWTGMSIRAEGNAVTEAGKKVLREGVPVLKEFTHCESIDVVTRAGAGGLILTESARPAGQQSQEVSDMDAEQLKNLEASNKRLLERALRGDAREAAVRILATVTLPDISKQRVIEAVLARTIPVTEAGELDQTKFAEAVNLEAKREGEYAASLTGSGRVIGMGTGAPAPTTQTLTEAEKQALRDKQRAADVRMYEALGMPKAAAERAADKPWGEEEAA